jgi:hypothetical protein
MLGTTSFLVSENRTSASPRLSPPFPRGRTAGSGEVRVVVAAAA